MNWFVLYVKSRSEKKVADQLEKLGITVYCPMITQIKQWSDRKRKVEVPLFHSYIFVQLAEKDREIVFHVPGVVRYLFWLRKLAIVKDKEIQVLKDWLSGDLIDATIENLKTGFRMQIPSGPFKGKEGVVQEVSKNRVQLILLDLGIKVTLTRSSI